jgi:hypothetical protein
MESNYTDTVSGEELYVNVSYNGSKHYFKDKKKSIRHRIDGPAIGDVNGYTVWYVDDKLHRIDGQAVEYSISGYKAWYINDVLIFGVDRDNRLVNRMR